MILFFDFYFWNNSYRVSVYWIRLYDYILHFLNGLQNFVINVMIYTIRQLPSKFNDDSSEVFLKHVQSSLKGLQNESSFGVKTNEYPLSKSHRHLRFTAVDPLWWITRPSSSHTDFVYIQSLVPSVLNTNGWKRSGKHFSLSRFPRKTHFLPTYVKKT